MALTKTDLKKIEELIDSRLDVKIFPIVNSVVNNAIDNFRLEMNGRFNALSELHQRDIARLEDKISHLPTKEDYFAREDKVITLLNQLLQEQQILTKQVSRNTRDVENLDARVVNLEEVIKIERK